MNRPRIAWLAIALLLSCVVLLVLFLPARWALPFVQARLRGLSLGQVHGTVWDGAAEQVHGRDGRPLGRLQWRLARSALWGRLDLQLDFAATALTARGHLQRDAQGRLLWTDVAVQAGLAAWTPRLDSPLGEPQGTLALRLRRAVLQADWPVELEGDAHWADAAMQVRAGSVVLGNLETNLVAANGVMHGRLGDDGHGPLHVEGQWQASPLGWRLDALLQPRTGDKALRNWLAHLGPPDPDGSVRLRRRGGLAAAAETER
ncbi:MAG TPA: type II secretion system protein N [Frateuria sp.]|uniref:type II secretion system protein N n=1 Tax=Frateuria sp. TaxID=2211372 RepID=UPI002DEECB03|nr:type II secretion system protein N [Frateuria sp.]